MPLYYCNRIGSKRIKFNTTRCTVAQYWVLKWKKKTADNIQGKGDRWINSWKILQFIFSDLGKSHRKVAPTGAQRITLTTPPLSLKDNFKITDFLPGGRGKFLFIKLPLYHSSSFTFSFFFLRRDKALHQTTSVYKK